MAGYGDSTFGAIPYGGGASGPAASTVNVGQAPEADSALTLASVTVGAVVSLGQATETDSALTLASITVGKIVTLGRATETDSAFAVTIVTGTIINLGRATETDTGLSVTLASIQLGQASEADSALAVTVAVGVTVTLGMATEADSAFPVDFNPPTVINLGRATETDTGFSVTLSYSYSVPDRSNRANGLELTGSLPLEFDPAVDPAPARAAKRAAIKATAWSGVTRTGTAYKLNDVVTKDKRNLRERIIIGGKDVTYFRGVETTITWQLVSPLLYGPATVTLPQINPAFEAIGQGPLKWIRKGATVRVQLVNDADEVVERGLYRGLVTAWDEDGTDLTVQIGGEASGRAAMRRRPLPVYSDHVTVGRTAYSLVHNLGLPFKPFLGPADPNIVLPRIGGMWYSEAIEHLCKMSQRRDGTQYTIMPDNDGDYRFRVKDRNTIHATVYVDGTRVRANVRSDMAEEHNRVFVNSVTPAGERMTGIVSPGIVQGDPPPFPGVLAEGDDTPAVVTLIVKLHWAGLLDVGGQTGFDENVTEAIEDLQEMAGLPVTGVVNEATWNALWDLGVTGYSLKWAHREPVASTSRVRQWRVTPDGSVLGRNPNWNPNWPAVDTEVDLGSFISARQRRRIGRAALHSDDRDNWVGDIEIPMGAVIAGEHNPGDPLTAADLMDTRLLKPGMNLWCPGFQSETGTLFHITGYDRATQKFQVDTRARDTLEVDDVIRRARQQRMWRNGRRASIESKDVVGEWDGAAGGQLYQDVSVRGGHWTVFGVPAGGEGTISRLRVKTNPDTEFAVAVFGSTIHSIDGFADALDRRMGDPLTEDGYANWDDHDRRDWLKAKGLLYMAGSPDDPCGYEPRAKSRGGDLTGLFEDYAGVAYRTERFPILFVAVWAADDTVIPAGRLMWNQLDPGA